MASANCNNNNNNWVYRKPVVIVGGGVAGVKCAETLAELNSNQNIVLVSSSQLVKTVANLKQLTQLAMDFSIQQRHLHHLTDAYPNIKVILGMVTEFYYAHKSISIDNKYTISYSKLCICTGAVPNLLAKGNPLIHGIRDTESVEELQQRLSTARKVLIVGNGGIAIELVYEVRGCEIVWAIKDDSICTVFLDKGAAQFLLPAMKLKNEKKGNTCTGVTIPVKRIKFMHDTVTGSVKMKSHTSSIKGSALGPDWTLEFFKSGNLQPSNVKIEYNTEVKNILLQGKDYFSDDKLTEDSNWPLIIELTNGKKFGCDFIVSATGVKPNSFPFSTCELLKLSSDGGILINEEMQTSLDDVYAAGDVSTVDWDLSQINNNVWFQMRLWTQALQMGVYSGKCIDAHMNKQNLLLDFCFEMFVHVTRFFGHRVVLMGNFNGVGLDKEDSEYLLRVTPELEYIKLILYKDVLVGAVLIGETGLEETFENLILNQLDLSRLKDNLLNPDIEIDDYFD